MFGTWAIDREASIKLFGRPLPGEPDDDDAYQRRRADRQRRRRMQLTVLAGLLGDDDQYYSDRVYPAKSFVTSTQTGELWSPYRLWRAGKASPAACHFCGHEKGTTEHLLINFFAFHEARWGDDTLRQVLPDLALLPTCLRTYGWAPARFASALEPYCGFDRPGANDEDVGSRQGVLTSDAFLAKRLRCYCVGIADGDMQGVLAQRLFMRLQRGGHCRRDRRRVARCLGVWKRAGRLHGRLGPSSSQSLVCF